MPDESVPDILPGGELYTGGWKMCYEEGVPIEPGSKLAKLLERCNKKEPPCETNDPS